MVLPHPPSVAVVACRVLEAEVNHLAASAPRVVRTEFLDIALHERPNVLRAALVAAIARAEADQRIEVIVLVYGVCGLAAIGLSPRRCRLVLPRAHDCLTLFLGSKERYAEIMSRAPGTHWYTPGWNRARRVPGPERDAALRAEYAAKFGQEEAEALMAMEREAFRQHGQAGYTDLGLAGSADQKRYAEYCAASLGWSCTEHRGDAALLRALLTGDWDEQRFLVVAPGAKVAFSADDAIVRTVPSVPGLLDAP